ncbi:MAG: glycosyltransferase family 4 protein [Candidatus Pacearchaeota archaeon]|nr:glycosyltransferase family 4 protein [Candidatus Pacearchaeota archaeon]
MKIIMLCDFYNENLEYQENLLTKYYAKFEHDVVVITSTFDSVFDYYSCNHDNSWPEKVYYDGKAKIIKLRYRFNYLNRLRAYTNILPILDEENPDLIYVHDIIPNMLEAVKYLRKHPNCKMIMDYHADYSNSGKNWLSLSVLHGVIRKWYLDKTRKYLSKIFPVVPAGVKFLHEVYKVPLDEMEVLPLGADTDLAEQCKKSNNLRNLRYKYNIKSNSKVILTGGKLSPRKQTELLIQAFKDLGNENVCLLIVGESAKEDKQYKNMLLQESQDSSNIYFVGWLDKVGIYEHLAISDIAVFPASQSIIWQQAISMGLPLIVGNTGEQSIEYLNIYKNIVILEKSKINPISIKHHIDRILSDPLLYQNMSEGALKVSRECLDWNSLIDKTLRYNSE